VDATFPPLTRARVRRGAKIDRLVAFAALRVAKSGQVGCSAMLWWARWNDLALRIRVLLDCGGSCIGLASRTRYEYLVFVCIIATALIREHSEPMVHR
jgi:hypothetical protein